MEKGRIDSHLADQANPHNVTPAQIGLGNVTNETKATMFTNPTFTGVPTAPTAVQETATEQIATTAFVHTVVENAKSTLTTTIENTESALSTAIEDEVTARENAIAQQATAFNSALQTESATRAQAISDETLARSEAITQAIADETLARTEAIEALLNDLLANYGITLNAPQFEITSQENQDEGKVTMTVLADNECTVIWYKK